MLKIDVANVSINWLGHASFKITDKIDNRVIYIDPYKISEKNEKADIILVTHSHFDHCSIKDLQKISDPKTVILAPADCMSKFQGKFDFRDSRIMNPGASVNLGNIEIETIPAYNTNKQFHPKENEWVGFVIGLNSKRIYHCGDTDFIPEMNSLKNIDIALIAVSGTYVMTAEEAAQAVNSFKPKLAIPMHYSEVVGTEADANKFKELAEVPVEILKKE